MGSNQSSASQMNGKKSREKEGRVSSAGPSIPPPVVQMIEPDTDSHLNFQVNSLGTYIIKLSE